MRIWYSSHFCNSHAVMHLLSFMQTQCHLLCVLHHGNNLMKEVTIYELVSSTADITFALVLAPRDWPKQYVLLLLIHECSNSLLKLSISPDKSLCQTALSVEVNHSVGNSCMQGIWYHRSVIIPCF